MHPTNVTPVWKIVLQYALASKKDLTNSFIVDIIEHQSLQNKIKRYYGNGLETAR